MFVKATHDIIKLDMQTALPMVLSAIKAQTLQCYNVKKADETCRYEGPCAIGICIDFEVRHELDVISSNDDYSRMKLLKKYFGAEIDDSSISINGFIDRFYELGIFDIPKEQVRNFKDMQRKHDDAVLASTLCFEYKENTLGYINAKEEYEKSIVRFEEYVRELAFKYGVPIE